MTMTKCPDCDKEVSNLFQHLGTCTKKPKKEKPRTPPQAPKIIPIKENPLNPPRGRPKGPSCSICNLPGHALSLCKKHYMADYMKRKRSP